MRVWNYSVRGIATRLFLTCWLIYSLHFASNTVREIYLALAIGDHLSFRVDEYANMHPDLFEHPGYGWHIGANPGGSMIAAVPYALARPVIDPVVGAVNENRAGSEPPAYDSPWPMSREFYAEAWRRGLDVKFGLGALVMHVGAMAPLSSLGVVLMFLVLRRELESEHEALVYALLYAFGTAVFFRSGYLNHNMLLGHAVFGAFVLLWRGIGQRVILGAGLLGGLGVLLDYSGVVPLGLLFFYAVYRGLRAERPWWESGWMVVGSLPPIGLLWFYQWASFGHPFYPGQHWMPPVEWIDIGYQGFGWPQIELLWILLADYRFGLFLTTPLFLFALVAPFAPRMGSLRAAALWVVLGLPTALWVFFGCVQYTRLQYATGIRYLAPVFPFLFLAAVPVLRRLPRWGLYFVGIAAVAQAWCMAMYRDVERGYGLAEPLLQVLLGGPKLPFLTVLSRMEAYRDEYLPWGASPLPFFALAAVILYGLWSPRVWRRDTAE